MRGSREISLVPSLHRASTDALMTRKIVKSRMIGFLRGKLEAGMNELGICIARYESC